MLSGLTLLRVPISRSDVVFLKTQFRVEIVFRSESSDTDMLYIWWASERPRYVTFSHVDAVFLYIAKCIHVMN